MDSLTVTPGQRGLRLAGLAGAFALGAVLLVAAYAKAIDPSAFAEQIHGDGLDRFLSAPLLALLGVGVEVLLGSLLVLEVRRLWVLIPAAAQVAFFLFLTGRAYWQFVHGTLPADANCGCFGNLVERTPAQAFWQDAALLVPALVLSFLGRSRGVSRFPVARSVLAAVLTTGAVAFARVAPTLPLDDLATRLKPGMAINEICAGAKADRVCFGSVVPEIEQGRHLLILADLTAPAFTAEVDKLNAYAQGGRGPKLWVLSGAAPEVTRAFFWKNGPAFDVREAPQALLRPLYRKLPRAFLVESGTVTHTWSGLPPLDELGEAVRLAGVEKGSS